MPIVEPRVDRDKLSELLAEGHESAELDFKETVDLGSTAGKVELCKDVAAMQSSGGGYIVIGTDDHGVPCRSLDEDDQARLDEARLRPAMEKWLPAPLGLLTTIHTVEHDAQSFALGLVYVAPSPDGFTITKTPGQYSDPRNAAKQKTAFRANEVLVRRGTSSQPWRQEDIRPLVRRLVEAEKESWRAELDPWLAKQAAEAARAFGVARGPLETLTWEVDVDAFDRAVLELVRHDDDIALREFAARAESRVNEKRVDERGADEIKLILDRVAEVVAIHIAYDRPMELPLEGLGRLYDLGVDSHSDLVRDKGLGEDLLALLVGRHLFALGGLIVRRQRWDLIPRLLVPPSRKVARIYPNWLRHASVSAAQHEQWIIGHAADAARRGRILSSHADERDAILDSVCQFDLLQGLRSIGDQGWDTYSFFPSFYRYRNHRTEPIVVRLIEERGLRDACFPDKDDRALAQALHTLDRAARKEAFALSGWRRFFDRTIIDFLRQHLPTDEFDYR